MHDLAWYYKAHDNPQKALEYLKKSYTTRKEIYKDKDSKDIADSLNSIGATYMELFKEQKAQGENIDKNNLDEGLEHQIKSLEMRERLFGGSKSSDYVNSYSRLGETYRELGDNDGTDKYNLSQMDCYKEALKYFNKMLSLTYELYEDCTHTHIAGSFQRMAEIYERLDEKQKMAECYKKSYLILIARGSDFTHKGDMEVKTKIEEYVPEFKEMIDTMDINQLRESLLFNQSDKDCEKYCNRAMEQIFADSFATPSSSDQMDIAGNHSSDNID